MDYPKLRELDLFPIEVSGQKMIGIRDPLNFADGVAVPQQLFLMLSLLDGQHSVVDIQVEYMRQFGELVNRELFEGILNDLDAGLLLDNENFQRKRSEIENEFRRASVRPAALAGKSYDQSPDKLAEQIEGFFSHADGPGLPNARKPTSALKGVIAPHIDFLRGGPCFAWAYKEVAENTTAEVFIIFGTAHVGMTQPFGMTYKDFETPFGTLHCDRDIVKGIESRVNFDLFGDEFVHRSEHSIEFQTIFLSYLFRDRKDIRIVPILCGSFHQMIASRTQPIDDAHIREFITAVRESVTGHGRKICYVAGADLAHVGPRFGDRYPVSATFMKLLEADDRRMLERVENVDAAGFFANIQSDGDRRKICGLPPIYTMMSVMEARSGKLLKYQQWPDPNGMVSFASMGFY